MQKTSSAPVNQNMPNQSMSQQNLMNNMYNKENNNEEMSNQMVGSTFAEQNKRKYIFKKGTKAYKKRGKDGDLHGFPMPVYYTTFINIGKIYTIF